MLQIFGARLFETEHLAALRIDAGHNVPDGPVLAGRVHCLEDQQDRVAIRRVMQTSQFAQLLNVLLQKLVILLLRFAHRFHQWRPLFDFDRGTGPHSEIF